MKNASEIRDYVVFSLNGEIIRVRGKDAQLNFSDFLRRKRNLPGTKVVCAEGDCGACSILRYFPFPRSAVPRFEVINSCIARVAQLDGSVIVTVEGIQLADTLHPVQKAMIDCNGSQCGYCTPGFVVAIADHFQKGPESRDRQSVKNALTGNLCRCTGYEGILEAAISVQDSADLNLSKRYLQADLLKDLEAESCRSLRLSDDQDQEVFFAPADLESLRRFRIEEKEAVVLAAGTDLGVQRNKHSRYLSKILSLHLLEDLYAITKTDDRLKVGARVSLSDLRRAVKEYPDLANFLNIFASPQIKNFATLVGNLANASPIADTPPFLLALNAEVEIWDPESAATRVLPLEQFYVDYKKTQLKVGEIIFSVSFSLPKISDRLMIRKISQRRDLDISTVNAAFALRNEKSRRVVTLAVGGVAAIPLRLRRTEAFLSLEKLPEGAIAEALRIAQEEITPLSDLRGTSAFRRLLVRNLLRDFLQKNEDFFHG